MALLTSRKQRKDVRLSFQDDMLFVETDGKLQAIPLTWIPDLKNASAEQQAGWRLTDKGLRWDDLDVDIIL